ncbi:hypothetical protein GMRT_11006 [Giardia muris]|uniref:Uncharacterized protein n=1 Tax=Giardia muris TaxID=5742 RepID=A0A4Z1T817_GIAMU|nr:hypothetical protein GMRT_11006 [Giardia muris]|eukprot:TNJ29307.1 hypothetical protein GMRT_11006 [Giardia muris]
MATPGNTLSAVRGGGPDFTFTRRRFEHTNLPLTAGSGSSFSLVSSSSATHSYASGLRGGGLARSLATRLADTSGYIGSARRTSEMLGQLSAGGVGPAPQSITRTPVYDKLASVDQLTLHADYVPRWASNRTYEAGIGTHVSDNLRSISVNNALADAYNSATGRYGQASTYYMKG